MFKLTLKALCVQYNIYVFNIPSLGCILISDLFVSDLFLHLFIGNSTLLGPALFYTEDVFCIRYFIPAKIGIKSSKECFICTCIWLHMFELTAKGCCIIQ